MKRKLLLCMGAMLLAGTLAAQVPVPEWETGVEQIKSLIKTDPGQASATAGELLKGKNKKNVSLIISIARAYLNVGKLPEAESYLKMVGHKLGEFAPTRTFKGHAGSKTSNTGK